ncbi:MAG: antitoxin CptB [Motiliproteus sp.]|jgi:antitoxin CptB
MYSETDINRLRWHCRRGMLELDVLLTPYLEGHFGALSLQDQQLFERLIAGEDQDLFSWFMRSSVPEDPGFRRMVGMILADVPT